MAADCSNSTARRSCRSSRRDLGLKNTMQVPRITKITVNMGVGEAVADKKVMDAAAADMAKITGQKPLITKSQEVGRDLQGARRPGDRLQGHAARRRACTSSWTASSTSPCRASATSAASRARSFDGRGNYSLGVKEQIIFPEIQYDQIDPIRGMDITITTSARDDKQGRALLEAFNFPFRKNRLPAYGEDEHGRAREAPRSRSRRSTRRGAPSSRS